jgi:hypothetical protein
LENDEGGLVVNENENRITRMLAAEEANPNAMSNA